MPVIWQKPLALRSLGAPPSGVVLIGDSLAVGLTEPLKTELAAVAFTPYAKAGTAIQSWLAGAQSADLVAALAKTPELVLVSLGTNDTAGKISTDVLKSRVAELVARIKKAGAKPVWLLPGKLPWPSAALTAAVAASGVAAIDQPPIAKADGIHPSGAGYQQWAKTIAQKLKGPAVVGTSERSILAVPGLEKNTTNAFRWALLELSDRGGLNHDYVATVISFETGGTFSPSIQNPKSKATGLLQFMPFWIAKQGMTPAAFAALSAIAQLKFVEKFYKGNAPKGLTTLCDHYLAVFSPYFIGHPETEVMAAKGSTAPYAGPGSGLTQAKVYDQNSGFDKTGKGYFTVADVCATVKSRYDAAGGKRIVVTPPVAAAAGAGAGVVVAVVLALGAAALALWGRR